MRCECCGRFPAELKDIRDTGGFGHTTEYSVCRVCFNLNSETFFDVIEERLDLIPVDRGNGRFEIILFNETDDLIGRFEIEFDKNIPEALTSLEDEVKLENIGVDYYE